MLYFISPCVEICPSHLNHSNNFRRSGQRPGTNSEDSLLIKGKDKSIHKNSWMCLVWEETRALTGNPCKHGKNMPLSSFGIVIINLNATCYFGWKTQLSLQFPAKKTEQLGRESNWANRARERVEGRASGRWKEKKKHATRQKLTVKRKTEVRMRKKRMP